MKQMIGKVFTALFLIGSAVPAIAADAPAAVGQPAQAPAAATPAAGQSAPAQAQSQTETYQVPNEVLALMGQVQQAQVDPGGKFDGSLTVNSAKGPLTYTFSKSVPKIKAKAVKPSAAEEDQQEDNGPSGRGNVGNLSANPDENSGSKSPKHPAVHEFWGKIHHWVKRNHVEKIANWAATGAMTGAGFFYFAHAALIIGAGSILWPSLLGLAIGGFLGWIFAGPPDKNWEV